jgi:hypothetical protein
VVVMGLLGHSLTAEVGLLRADRLSRADTRGDLPVLMGLVMSALLLRPVKGTR